MPTQINLSYTDEFALGADTLDFLYRVIQTFQPRLIVESGTYHAHFATVAAGALRELGRGYVVTADPINYCRLGNVTANQLEDYVEFVFGDFARIAELHPEIVGAVDMAFVDSGAPFALEWEGGVRFRHYELAKTWLRPGGLLVVDDMTVRDWPGADTIYAEAGIFVPIGHGLTIWQKPLEHV